MTLEFESALAAVTAAVTEINLSRDIDSQLSTAPDAVLYGEGSALDSLGLVSVVMVAEQHIGDATGEDIILASEAAMSRKRSPYRSLRALAEYAVEASRELQASQ